MERSSNGWAVSGRHFYVWEEDSLEACEIGAGLAALDADRETATALRASAGPLDELLLPSDFSPAADGALVQAVDLARSRGASLHLLHAVEGAEWALLGSPAQATWIRARERDSRARQLRQRAAFVEGHGIHPQLHLFDGDPAEVIYRVARDLPADLIVMGARGRGRADPDAVGQVAERTAARAPCPVLAVEIRC
jgi:nucleotide-binding universal stress UspA family protein